MLHLQAAVFNSHKLPNAFLLLLLYNNPTNAAIKSVGLLANVQEHLILVCELLRANLYEFQKYQRENGDDPYFTPPRIQRIAIQVGI